MKKRNILIGAASFAVASVAIGGGAVVSSSAMAASGDTPKATLTIVHSDGSEAVTCTFDDVALPTPPPGAAAGIGAGANTGGAHIVSGVIVRGDAPTGAPSPVGGSSTLADPADGGPTLVFGGAGAPDGAPSLSDVPAGGAGVPVPGVVMSGVPAPGSSLTGSAGLTMIGEDGRVTANVPTRAGTADECAAMRKDLPTP